MQNCNSCPYTEVSPAWAREFAAIDMCIYKDWNVPNVSEKAKMRELTIKPLRRDEYILFKNYQASRKKNKHIPIDLKFFQEAAPPFLFWKG